MNPSVASVVTDEGVPLSFSPAGLGSRAAAALLDWTLVYAATTVLFAGVSGIGASGAPTWVTSVALTILGGVAFLGYPITMETLWNGRTLGKAAAGIRVVTRSGGPIGFRQAALRGALLLIDVTALPVGGIGVTSMLLTRRSARLGDLAASTMVVRDRPATLTPPKPVMFWPPHGWERYAASLDVGDLDAAGYRLVRSFLTRAGQLTLPARTSLAAELAHEVSGRLRAAPPPQIGPELYLVCVAAAYQARFRRGPVGAWAAQ